MTTYYEIQVVAEFSDESAAETIIATLGSAGLPVTLTPERTFVVRFEGRVHRVEGMSRIYIVPYENRVLQV